MSDVELSDEDLRGFLDLPTELFGVFDPKHGSAWCSPAVAAVLGYGPDELQHVDLASLVHPDDLGAPTDDVEDFPRDGGALTLEVRCRRRVGGWRWLQWCGAWDDQQGVLYGAASDVTERREARDAARATERLVEAILDHSTSAVFVQDLDARFVLVNDAFVELFGRTRAQILGRTRSEVWGDEADALERCELAVTRSGVPDVRDDRLPGDDGPHTLMTVRFPLRDASGAVVGLAGIATDVSERTDAERALVERERVLDTIFRACPDIVTVLGPGGAVRAVSPASARILGYSLDEGGEDLRDLVHADDAAGVVEGIRSLLSGSRSQVEVRSRIRHRDGHWVTLDTRGQALAGADPDGASAGAVLLSRDVSADLAFEEELQSAVETAERASTAKSEFLSRMSHELRTPLNSVLGFAQLLDLGELDQQQHEAVGHIVRAGRHLLGLIDEVLDIARIESGRLDISTDPIPLRAVVSDAVDLARPLAEDRGVELTVDFADCAEDAHVTADRQRLLQVLLNLLSNGVKYNERGGSVSVTTRCAGSSTEIVVRDTGPGIDPADAHRVFAPFDRLGAERSGIQGTGVGLTLSKRLVEEMGGSIELDSAPGEGTAFTVSLCTAPAGTDVARGTRTTRPRASVQGSLRVLHIEDNHANLELVEQVLAHAGNVDLRAAMSGSLGLELAREHRPDLVLLDLHLPDLPGTEVLRRLQADPSTADVPVVVVSADATPTTIRSLRAAGVLAYLTKPIDVRELLRVVAQVSGEVER